MSLCSSIVSTAFHKSSISHYPFLDDPFAAMWWWHVSSSSSSSSSRLVQLQPMFNGRGRHLVGEMLAQDDPDQGSPRKRGRSVEYCRLIFIQIHYKHDNPVLRLWDWMVLLGCYLKR